MKILPTITTVVLLAFAGVARSADWKPAASPLMTKWASEVKPEKVLPEYPRPQLVREKWLNLNGLWEFQWIMDGNVPAPGEKLAQQILVPFTPEAALSGIGKHESDRLLYRRSFEVPSDWKDQRVLLHFGAVDWETTVRVNGKEVGKHRGGYDPFTFDVTDAIERDSANELTVEVFDPTDKGFQPTGKQRLEPRGIWYTPTSGIWQTVWLEPVPEENYVKRIHAVPDLDSKSVSVTVEVGRESASSMDLIVTDGENVVAKAQGVSGRAVKIALSEVKHWSPEDPHLYGLQVVLRSRGLQPDDRIETVKSYFAMREVKVAKDKNGVNRLFLNGEPYFQLGFLDQGYWPDGLYTAPTDEALRYDIEITKQLGFNMARKHMKTEPARWYYWCDKLGLLVWQDMPSMRSETITEEAKKNFESEWKAIIDALRFHPSIVTWVVFNEGWGQYDTPRLTEWTKEYDPTRIVDNASGWVDANVGDVIDAHVYPGPGAPPMEEDRAAVLGEFGGLGLYVEGHHWTEKNFSYSGMESAEELEQEYARLMGRLWGLQRDAGLSAAVYTQTTDVEGEINGFMTYDRILKVDVAKIKAANEGRVPIMTSEVFIPTSKEEPQTWKYTFEKPGEDWMKPELDDSSWKSGPGGFGTEGTPGAVVRTKWDTSDIWLRRTIKLPADLDPKQLATLVHHDEACEIYYNGVLGTRARYHSSNYEEKGIRGPAVDAMKAGEDVVIAVHCNQTTGGQYIDLGLLKVVEE